MKTEVLVDGMACAGCANTVKTKFESLAEVNSVLVDLDGKKAVLESDRDLSKNELNTALEETSYTVTEVL